MDLFSGKFCTLPTVIVLLIAGCLPGCSSTPDYPERSASTRAAPARNAHPGVKIASTMIGTPYRYGGSSPRGFDCSGLVYYSYRKAGINVPRTTQAQLRHARRVSPANLSPGDLLFFKLNRQRVSHVAIYTGGDRFIHAPSSGKRVSYGSMRNPYWQSRLIAAGRY